MFYFFFLPSPPKTILRSTALLFNFQFQKSFSVLVVYKNLTHLHTNKNPSSSVSDNSATTARRLFAPKVVLYLIYIILLFLYRNPRGECILEGSGSVVLQKLNVVYVTVMKHLQDGGGVSNK